METVARQTERTLVDEAVAEIPDGSAPGRGWLGRNWTGLVGAAMYVIVAVADAGDVVHPSRDWFMLYAWGVVAGFLVALWLAGPSERDRWKPERRFARRV